MEIRKHTFIMSDTIQKAYVGWMREDLETSFNLATLALWRSEQHGLWIAPDEERFLRVATDNPPHTLV